MRVLLVEDDLDFAASIDRALRAVDGCDVTWKKSRAAALMALDEEPFDVVLLDRRIPSEDGVLDDDVSHGWAVFQTVREKLPGTSVWFLTATEDVDFSTDVLNQFGRTGDIHCCDRDESVYRVFWKRRMTDCIAAAREFRTEVQRTEDINLNLVGEPVNLRPEEERLLKLFARRHRGIAIQARPLGGGLSGARVLRVTVQNTAGQDTVTSVAKVGAFEEIGAERSRYNSEIARLRPGSTPQLTGDISLGASGYAGIFYAVVGTEVTDLFVKLSADPRGAAEVPSQLLAAQAPWSAARGLERMRVGAIRRRLISDVELATVEGELRDIDIAQLEALEINVALCVQHGDLHCANVLFDDRDLPMLIDYAEAGSTLASLDPIVLELSTIFHKHAPERNGWPKEEEALQWHDVSTFAAGAPFEAYLLECRLWATSVAGSPEEVLAVGYAYALRQLKYGDTDKVLARAIIRSCITALTDIAT